MVGKRMVDDKKEEDFEKQIDEIKMRHDELVDKEIEEHIKLRLGQAVALKYGFESRIYTKLDLEKMEKENEDKKERRFMESFTRLTDGGLFWHSFDKDIKDINIEKNREKMLDIMKNIYNRTKEVLIEIGEIK